MADSVISVQEEGSNAGGSGEQERPSSVTAHARVPWFMRPWMTPFERLNPAASPGALAARAAYKEARTTYAHARGYEYALMYAHCRAYLLLAVKVSGLAAFSLSTLVYIGGYVQSLGNVDFFCFLAITVIQAAGIFQDWENSLKYLIHFVEIVYGFSDKLFRSASVMGILISFISALVAIPLLVLVLSVQLFYLLGPLICAAISSWRLANFNHGNHRDGTDSTADMVATLNIFYSLIVLQGTMFLVLLLVMFIYSEIVASCLDSLERLPDKWGMDAICRYINDISTKCTKDPVSIKGMDLIKYAAELLDSGSQEDYLYGARLLSAFIKKGKDISWLLLPSTNRIQRLIDSLWISSGTIDENTEIRVLAATIVADLAGHIDVARYPGAMRYISSLLFQEETTQGYGNSSKQASDPQPPKDIEGPVILFYSEEVLMKNLARREEGREWTLMNDQQRLGISQERRWQKGQGGTRNKLVQLGLIILERLASNSDNRRLICSTPGLLPKITAPLYSATLIKDEELENKAWADIVTRCLKVLHQLIRAPGWPSRRLRHEIFSEDHALSNLTSILELGNEFDHQELKLRAMEILTELALDLSINLSREIKEVLVTKLFLLANGDDEESAAVAGRALVSLSTNSESNSALIMTTQDDIIALLTGIVDDESITRRTIAADILANLCAHYNVDNMKDILPKVLKKIMSIKTKSERRRTHSISTDVDDTEIVEISDQEREEQEAFLSLAQVICDKLDSANLDGAIQNEINAATEEQRREAFVDKLKTIVDDNSNDPTADSLRIVKLCCRIAKSMMKRNPVQLVSPVSTSQSCNSVFLLEQLVSQSNRISQMNKKIESLLSEASKTMSELESCMLFVGTDFGPKKAVRPLFSEIERTWSENSQ